MKMFLCQIRNWQVFAYLDISFSFWNLNQWTLCNDNLFAIFEAKLTFSASPFLRAVDRKLQEVYQSSCFSFD